MPDMNETTNIVTWTFPKIAGVVLTIKLFSDIGNDQLILRNDTNRKICFVLTDEGGGSWSLPDSITISPNSEVILEVYILPDFTVALKNEDGETISERSFIETSR